MAQEPREPEGGAERPSLEKQLEAAKARPGTAFAKFIELNQEFELLRRGEHEHDNTDLPLWLRVYWRKQHPEEPHSPAGPAADYPESLNRIQEWMQVNQDLLPDPERWLRASEHKPRGGRRDY